MKKFDYIGDVIGKRSNVPLAVLLFGLAVAFAAISGCGKGGEDTSASTPLTKSQYTKQANAVCERATERKEQSLRAAIEQSGKGLFETPPAELAKMVQGVLPPYKKAMVQLNDLRPPAKDEAEIKKILREFKSAVEETEKHPAQAIQNTFFKKPDEAAFKYGLTACIL